MIRPISKARAVRLREYAKAKRAWLAVTSNQRCRMCGRGPVDVHHVRGRLGDLLTDTRYWLPLCRRHHDWVGDNPAKARACGMLAQAGEWNTKP